MQNIIDAFGRKRYIAEIQIPSGDSCYDGVFYGSCYSTDGVQENCGEYDKNLSAGLRCDFCLDDYPVIEEEPYEPVDERI